MTKLIAKIDAAITPKPLSPLERCKAAIRCAITDALDDYAAEVGWEQTNIEAVRYCARKAIEDWDDENHLPNWTEADL